MTRGVSRRSAAWGSGGMAGAVAASLGVVAFLGFTGFALDEAFRDTAISNLQERVENHADAYLGEFEFTRDGELIEPPRGQAPDARFLQPGSGLYAIARGRNWC